ncbi:hypothetical protein DFH07DRAFT_961956 [Mycena maculata]|uniref:Uncharacterized protein n=1 Tax=Mycena maculata TaxID=230809 RepID=A0AAD7IRI5_9AGAR|nr:hypothetical protein DFH07DRAFT_961956 [Mycena maculata]
MDLLNDNNKMVDAPADLAALEELWFNPLDPYDLSEAERCPSNSPGSPAVVRLTDRFNISEYVKLDNPGLAQLIEAHGKVPGTGEVMVVDGDNGEEGSAWNISDFL